MTTKTFAQESRKILMDGVAKKLLYWGFNPKGEVLESPSKVSGGYSFRGEVNDDSNVPDLWEALKRAIANKGIEVIVEEAAYTWFNRLMALRIMAKNGYEPSLLQNAEGLKHTPLLLQRARQGQYAFLNPEEQERLKKTIGDYSKDRETFALLLVGYCHSNKMLNNVFGKLDDYTELLLPDNILQDSGFLHLLNTTDAISDEEYKQVELIGWLYQFYISDKKDEVFASFKKRKKAEAKDIPAATQIFTPNWIVKYMVENTAGRIWLNKNPDSGIKANMKYFVDTSTSLSAGNELDTEQNRSAIINNVEKLTLLDPAVGSGHILVEGFDLLYQMYMEEYYSPEEAVESILKNNLYGLDLDERATQLANFAVLLKAATKYRDVFTKDWLPNVYAMPESTEFSTQELKDFLGEDGKAYLKELETAVSLMKQAKNLGSIMKLSLSSEAYDYIQERYKALLKDDYLDINLEIILQGLKAYIPILLIMTKKYASVVTNPPYMGNGTMNADLKNYVNTNYPLSKSDLFAVFMETCLDLSVPRGLMGMINQHSWMFLKRSYEKLRLSLIDNYKLLNLLHLGTKVFEELKGEKVQSAAFIFEKTKPINNKPIFYRLINYATNDKKENAFLLDKNKYSYWTQSDFNRIPNSSFGYWITSEVMNLFDENNFLENQLNSRVGLDTGNNDQFIRFWFEVGYLNINFRAENKDDFNLNHRWAPHSKGGQFKKWYGNLEAILKFDPLNYELLSNSGNNLPSRQFYFLEGLTWSRVGGGKFGVRYTPKGIVFNSSGPTGFSNQTYYFIAFLNSKVARDFIDIINPTLNFQVGTINKMPLKNNNDIKILVENIVADNISIAKSNWNSYETSWDFDRSPLLNKVSNIKETYATWLKDITQDFFQLHANEEELNRIFINNYGLQEELITDVALKDITILQDELKKKDLEALESEFREKGAEDIKLPIDKAEVISQFISYAIGIFMGRYRLDKPGLHIAHPTPTIEEITSYIYNEQEVIIDEDAILPLMGTRANFSDDISQRFHEFLDIVWGHEQRTENLNFIQDCLNKDLERFLVRDFYKYHTRMYKKKPIYWLFSSFKGAFQVLVYMHRMNAFTVEKIRANYLLEHLKKLSSEEARLIAQESSLSTQEAKQLDQIRKDITECETYDMELKEVADQQIEFDLDDGVTVNYAKFKNVVAKI